MVGGALMVGGVLTNLGEKPWLTCLGSHSRPVLYLFLTFYERAQMYGASLIRSLQRLYLQGVCIYDLRLPSLGSSDLRTL